MKKISNNKIITVVSIVAAICIVIAAFCSVFTFKIYKKFEKLIKIDAVVNSQYYGGINDDELDEALCEGYIDGIGDKYAYYKNNEQTHEKALDTNGKSVGIGVYVTKNFDNQNIVILKVMHNSPAHKAELKALDEIVEINGKSVEDEGFEEAVASLKVEENSKIMLKIKRSDKLLEKELVCQEFTTQNVYSRIIDGVGYVEIISFDRVTAEQFSKAVDSLVEKDVKGIVFDLRNNSGGTFDSMRKMLDKLVGEGVIVTVNYKDERKNQVLKSDKAEIDLPMVCLVNNKTASAAEIFAATLRDFEKGAIIGEKTYGKCVMQRTFSLKDGTSFRITVAKCLTKSGYDFNDIGLEPDQKVSFSEQQRKYFYKLTDEDEPFISAGVKWINENK